ncbi:hypothetical protein PHMEG_00029516 [Phytophthora megakarya]|uniref:Uncharacterized protein n=1 Tax=Phytophthora megakarya TaxID=4795 RepID=A0A225V2Y5_9STRA|nr:hypothetical protein PHMEG_00029516 [Phytophthora megakarya]
MKIHSLSEFSMLADPVASIDGTQVFYNVFATFTEDEIVYNYTFVDNAAYYSTQKLNNASSLPTVRCLKPEMDQLPPINTIVAGVNEATPISNIPSGVECASGNIFKMSVNDIDYALCTTGSRFKMYGSDIDFSVEYIDTFVNISTPLAKYENLSNCTTWISPIEVTSTGKSLLTGKFNAARRLEAEIEFIWEEDAPKCSCKSTPRPCIFIHGMGVPYELPDNQDSLQYWGDLSGHTPCCTTVKYAVLDTINNTWTNATQQQKVCDRALAVSKTSKKSTITDTIVVTHSMGNLMLAGAIANGRCKLDSSSTWVGLAAPMKGSKASDFIQESCAGETNFLLQKVVRDNNRCPPTTALKSMSYQGESHSTPELDAAYTAAQNVYRDQVFALMCSSSFFGLRSDNQTSLWALGIFAHHHSWKNDGMVEFQSCAVGFPESKFGKTWRDRFYKTKLNHYDMQFKYGDGLFSKAKMPVKWFECLL